MASRGERLASIMAAHVGCSSQKNIDLYRDIVIRPVDRTPSLEPYYLNNAKISTCALSICGAIRLAGCNEPECVATYLPSGHAMRDAMADEVSLARRSGAWVSGSMPVSPFKIGDCFIVTDENGSDAHTGMCLADAVVGSDGLWNIKTAEGGQWSGKDSSAILSFTRTFHVSGNRRMLGTRYLLGYVSAENLPIADVEINVDDPMPHAYPTGVNS